MVEHYSPTMSKRDFRCDSCRVVPVTYELFVLFPSGNTGSNSVWDAKRIDFPLSLLHAVQGPCAKTEHKLPIKSAVSGHLALCGAVADAVARYAEPST